MAALEENIEVECRHCGIPMEQHLGSGGQVRYFKCRSCRRWVSSTYADVFRADAKFRAREKKEAPAGEAAFEAVKGKLERWLASVDDRDPYRALGMSPLDSDDQIRARFRELAMAHHPDRGGAPEQMRELNLAYERILSHRAARRAERALERETSPVLPARTR